MQYFKDNNNPSMSELVNWFAINCPDLWDDLDNCKHSVRTDEPNPYHLENSALAHTMMVCLRAEDQNKIVKISALLHDIGKSQARTTIPFSEKKPVYSESNKIRNEGKDAGEHSGLSKVVPKSGLKTHFRGHEGVSTFLAVSILNKLRKLDVINYREMTEILNIISLHGTLFDNLKDGREYKPEEVIKKFRDINIYENFVAQVKADSTGRFFTSKDGRKNTGFSLGDTVFNRQTFNLYKQNLRNYSSEMSTITVLTGLPCSGKTAYVSNACNINDVIISRDDLLLRYGRQKFPYVKTYSEIFELLTDEMYKDVDGLLEKRFKDAVKDRKNIVIDMTCLSKKSRRKWLANVPEQYYKESVVFFADLDVIKARNVQRYKDTGKKMSDETLNEMMKSFIIPTYEEFDKITFEIN